MALTVVTIASLVWLVEEATGIYQWLKAFLSSSLSHSERSEECEERGRNREPTDEED
jgi:hypothetical protein